MKIVSREKTIFEIKMLTDLRQSFFRWLLRPVTGSESIIYLVVTTTLLIVLTIIFPNIRPLQPYVARTEVSYLDEDLNVSSDDSDDEYSDESISRLATGG